MKRVLLITYLLFIISLVSAEEFYKVFLVKPIQNSSFDDFEAIWEEGIHKETILIEEGCLFTLIYIKDENIKRSGGYTLDLNNDGSVDFSGSGNSPSDTLDFPVIVGPATLVLKSSPWSYGLHAAYSYLRSTTSVLTDGSTSIHAIVDSSGDVELEYAEGMIQWNYPKPETITDDIDL